MRCRLRKSACGFSLIELLVTIAIIALLASLLLSTLASAKKKAQSAYCMNNFRQLTIGWHLYADDNNDTLAKNFGVPDGTRPWWLCCVAGCLSPLNPTQYQAQATNAALMVPGLSGSIGPYVKSPRVYRCPSDKSAIVISGRSRARVRSVSANVYVGNDADTQVEISFIKIRRFFRYWALANLCVHR